MAKQREFRFSPVSLSQTCSSHYCQCFQFPRTMMARPFYSHHRGSYYLHYQIRVIVDFAIIVHNLFVLLTANHVAIGVRAHLALYGFTRYSVHTVMPQGRFVCYYLFFLIINTVLYCVSGEESGGSKICRGRKYEANYVLTATPTRTAVRV